MKGSFMKIDGKDFDFSKKASELTQKEVVDDSKKNQKELFNVFDENNDEKLSQAEIEKVINIFDAAEKEGDKNSELSDKEIQSGIDNLKKTYSEFAKGGFGLNDVKEFVKSLLEANEKKVSESKEADSPEESPSAAPEKLFDYVVPEGQSFKQLMTKILEKEGKTSPTKEDYEKAEEQFRADNPDIEIRERRGIKYLLVGSRVKVPTDFGEKLCDPDEEIEKWKQRVGLSKKPPKAEPTEESSSSEAPSEVTEAPAAEADENAVDNPDANASSTNKFDDNLGKYTGDVEAAAKALYRAGTDNDAIEKLISDKSRNDEMFPFMLEWNRSKSSEKKESFIEAFMSDAGHKQAKTYVPIIIESLVRQAKSLGIYNSEFEACVEAANKEIHKSDSWGWFSALRGMNDKIVCENVDKMVQLLSNKVGSQYGEPVKS